MDISVSALRLFEKYRGEFSRKKVLEVSRNTIPDCNWPWGRSSQQAEPTLPEPQSCLRMMPASGAWVPRSAELGESLEIHPKGLC